MKYGRKEAVRRSGEMGNSDCKPESGSNVDRTASKEQVNLRNVAALVLAAMALPGLAQVQPGPVAQLEPVVVSASNLALTAASSSSHVTVLTRDDIASNGYGSVAELLGAQAGLSVDRGGRTGGYSSLYLRGADPSHVVVLIDGVRQNDALSSRGSAVDLNTLLLADVEWIEVIRGNVSVANSEALAGLIHIHTRRTGKSGGALEGEAGGDGRRMFSAHAEHAGWSASASSFEDGHLIGTVRNRAANVGWVSSASEPWGVALSARVARSENSGFPDDSGGPALAVRRGLETRTSDTLQGSFRGWWTASPASRIEFTASVFDREERDDTPGIAGGVRDRAGFPAIGSDTGYQRSDVQLLWRNVWTSRLTSVVGVDVQREHGRFDSVIDYVRFKIPARFELSRMQTGPFAELRYDDGEWNAQAGVRELIASGLSDRSVQWHPAFSVQRKFAEMNVVIGASVSTATKLPSFYALGHPLIGNAALRPERAQQREVFVASLPGQVYSYRVAAFSSRYKDLVDFDAGPPPRLVNRAQIHVDGLEAQASFDVAKGVRASADAAWMRFSDPADGTPLRGRPRLQGGARVALPITERSDVSISARYVGRRFDSSIPTGDRWLSGYTLVNATASLRLVDDVLASLSLDNLLNRSAEETIGTSIGGRRIRINLQWRWR